MPITAPVSFSPERIAAIEAKKCDDARLGALADAIVQRIALNDAQFRYNDQTDNDARILAMLAQMGELKAQEKSDIKSMVVNTFLLADDVQLCCATFPKKAVTEWFFANAFFAAKHCPNVVQAWKSGGYVGSRLVMHNIAKKTEQSSDAQKIAILSRTTTEPLYAMVPELLAFGLPVWGCLSPLWIGKEGSALRNAAIAEGWNASFLPTMVWSTIWNKPEAWLQNIRYAYSILVCKWIMDAFNQGPIRTDPEGYFQTHCVMAENVHPLDATLALSLCRHSPIALPYTLDGHVAERNVELSLVKAITVIVQLRATRTGMPSLLQDLCEGRFGQENTESFCINGLM